MRGRWVAGLAAVGGWRCTLPKGRKGHPDSSGLISKQSSLTREPFDDLVEADGCREAGRFCGKNHEMLVGIYAV